MSSPARGLLRGLRAASLGVAGFVLALVAHVAAGGASPEPGVLLLLAGCTGLMTWLLTGVRVSPVRVVVFLAAMQVVLHEAVMRLSVPAPCLMPVMDPAAGGNAGMGPGMGHGGQPVLECATSMAPHPGLGPRSIFATTTMLGAHLIATMVMAALLAYGERALWFLAGLVRLPLCFSAVRPEPPKIRLFPYGVPRVARACFASGGVGRRGPPPGTSSPAFGPLPSGCA